MHADEKAIIDYLKGWSGSFVSRKEISRKAVDRKTYEQNPGWAIPVLAQLVRLGVVEGDHLGCFRLKLEDKKKKRRQHISPQMLKILKNCGKEFEGVEIDGENDKFVSPIRPYPKEVKPAAVPPPVPVPFPTSVMPPPVAPAAAPKDGQNSMKPEAMEEAPTPGAK